MITIEKNIPLLPQRRNDSSPQTRKILDMNVGDIIKLDPKQKLNYDWLKLRLGREFMRTNKGKFSYLTRTK